MSNYLDQDTYWMQRALELARRGIGVTSPNPAVGCVILDRAGQVVGEGWHEYDLLDHAEIVALKEAQQHAADRIQAARPTSPSSPATSPAARRPAPMPSSRPASPAWSPPPSTPTPPSPATAWKHCVQREFETSVGVCQTEARRLNEGFARWIQHHRPLVLMKVAMTLDARIAPPPGHTRRTRPTGSPAKPRAPPCSRCAGPPTPPWSASTPFSPTTPG